jgi:NAD(P)H-quinone oxidoreductase subunit 5
MGGLRKYMPITSLTFLVGTLAICGIPPFAGFWSKDEILSLAFGANPLLWLVGWLTAGLTAFYMFRMYFMTFEGGFKGNDKGISKQLLAASAPVFGPGAMDVKELDTHEHDHEHHSHEPHESPLTMTFPLIMLAIPSVLIGLVGRPWNNGFERFISIPGEVAEEVHHFEWNEFLIMGGSSVGIALIGITLASLMYLQKKINPADIAKKFPTLYDLSLHKWYFDDIYDRVFVMGSRRLARQIMEVDFRVIDGAVNFTGLATLVGGEGLKYLQNGRGQFYALIVFAAVLGFVVIFSVT